MSTPQSPIAELEARLAALIAQGVIVVDPRQTFVGAEVELSRIRPGAILHPGTRIHGARSFVGVHAEVGREGPAVLIDVALADQAVFASGYAEQSVLLGGARAGANAHLRSGSLLEEQASTAHCVGLKQTILLAFVTLGSLINFCDCLMAGGTSRDDHSEVGSGFIHFNFTPWGERGDKATASLIGDVVRGVFLREHRIFLGGMGGMVGPLGVGYGAISAAGQVLRRELDDDSFSLQAPRAVERPVRQGWRDPLQPRLRKNIAYVAQLFALREWYRQVRLARQAVDDPRRPVTDAALAVIESGIAERRRQTERFVLERGGRAPRFEFEADALPRCPWTLTPDEGEHLDWVRGLGEVEVREGQQWLAAIAEQVRTQSEAETRAT
ncbi:UDP-N-acetylglucosamine pyrophosphorylase [Nannocystaceae bacterium ST9]